MHRHMRSSQTATPRGINAEIHASSPHLAKARVDIFLDKSQTKQFTEWKCL